MTIDRAAVCERVPLAEIFCGDCGFFACVCQLRNRHDKGCKFLRAAVLSVELACEHGYQACPICDPCTCDPKRCEKGIR